MTKWVRPHVDLPIYDNEGTVIGLLSSLDHGNYMEPGIIGRLVYWRQENMKWFLTQFEATHQRTRNWLEQVILPSPDRIMFLIYVGDRLMGHYGTIFHSDTHAELDNAIRGEQGGPKGLMHYMEIALLAWLFGKMGIKTANLWVLQGNEATFKWHTSVGYSMGRESPLYQRTGSGETVYSTSGTEDELTDLRYFEMVISREALLEKHPWVSKYYQGMEG